MAYYRVGIIPAGGKATRFGGIYKECLPLPGGGTLLEKAVERLDFCDKIVVISNPEKMSLHAQILGDRADIAVQIRPELWGAVMSGWLNYEAERYYMTMPDTYTEGNSFGNEPDCEFGLGCFETNEPERFGVFKNGTVVDKDGSIAKPAQAWGVLSWDASVCRLWLEKQPADYTEAINQALAWKRWKTWSLGKYFDCANAERYFELIDYLRASNAN